jgi:sortase A
LLLRVGIGMMTFAVVLAVGVVIALALRNEAPGALALLPEPGPPETAAGSDPDPREEPEAEAPGSREAPEPQPESRAEPTPELPSQTEEGWQLPGEAEAQAATQPRYYDPHPNAAMTLTIEALGVYNAPVLGSDSPEALNAGVVHVPETSFPWDGGAQRNVYLAAHRLGYEGTGSRLLFYQLDRLGRGDEVVLEGRRVTYRYRVTEKLVVEPTDSWVMGQVRGRDMVSLQTCTPIPTFEKRLVVRADRI